MKYHVLFSVKDKKVVCSGTPFMIKNISSSDWTQPRTTRAVGQRLTTEQLRLLGINRKHLRTMCRK